MVCTLIDASLPFSQTFFSYCFCMLSDFAKVFEKKVWRVQVAHLHNAARALSSPSRCFGQFRIGHVRYINILTWLRGFRVKLLYLVLFSLYPSLFWELRDKRNLKNLQFWPESLGAMLEYWYIERGLLCSNKRTESRFRGIICIFLCFERYKMLIIPLNLDSVLLLQHNSKLAYC